MALTPQQLAELQRLKELMRPQAEDFNRRMQAVVNAEKGAGQPVTLPTDKKADGGLEKFLEHSKVKNRAYHGTQADFKTFKSGPRNRLVKGIWFTSSPESASFWAGNTEGSNVMPVHLAFRNPANRQDYDRMLDELPYEKKRTSSQRTSQLKKRGYDSLIMNGGTDNETYIALHPNQIKSAIGNRGTYDPNDPDITKAAGGNVSTPSQDVMRLAIGGQGPKNWLKGSVEQVIEPLKTSRLAADNFEEFRQAMGHDDPRVKSEKDRMDAINQWIDRNLGNYIKKQMATHDDPIRKLAEQGIVHMPHEEMGLDATESNANARREKLNAPRLGQSPEARSWEDAADMAMLPHSIRMLNLVKQSGGPGANLFEPWMEKADPDTQVYRPTDSMHAHYLGFDHLVDILKDDLAAGRIRPDQLNKVSIEHAVRRAHEVDQANKKAMSEAALKATEGMPVHKDYGDGYKWLELAMNHELPEGWSKSPSGTYVDPQGQQTIHHPNYLKLKDALAYESDMMGHCVGGEKLRDGTRTGGYTNDVVRGNKRIFSLRDAKNEPHVTIEVNPVNVQKGISNLPRAEREALAQQVKDQHFGGVMPGTSRENQYWELLDQAFIDKYGMPPPAIKQIKGKGNAKPKQDYIPYVQDFVKSGNWSEVGDIKNADMIKHKGQYMTHAEHDDWMLNQLKPDEKADGGSIHFKHDDSAKEVSPDTFLHAVKPLAMDNDDKETIAKFKAKMEHGKKINVLGISKTGYPDGRHRATAAKELGVKKVPVIDKSHKLAHGGKVTHAHHLDIEERML